MIDIGKAETQLNITETTPAKYRCMIGKLDGEVSTHGKLKTVAGIEKRLPGGKPRYFITYRNNVET